MEFFGNDRVNVDTGSRVNPSLALLASMLVIGDLSGTVEFVSQ